MDELGSRWQSQVPSIVSQNPPGQWHSQVPGVVSQISPEERHSQAHGLPIHHSPKHLSNDVDLPESAHEATSSASFQPEEHVSQLSQRSPSGLSSKSEQIKSHPTRLGSGQVSYPVPPIV